MKHIDAEKLIAEIERQKKAEGWCEVGKDTADVYYARGFRFACDNLLSVITSLQQDQPEVNLEKFTEKINTFKARYKHPESISINGAMAFMARMFYRYPNTARQWYEQLPKATMD